MKDDNGSRDGEGSVNPGSNLFVTGIHPKLTESEVSRLFEKYGEVEKAQIMRDPHTKESRGFGFVKMVTSDQADAAKDGLQGEVIEGRTLSIEKARRARPRTPTPGKYFGPPKRGESPSSFSRRRTRTDDTPQMVLLVVVVEAAALTTGAPGVATAVATAAATTLTATVVARIAVTTTVATTVVATTEATAMTVADTNVATVRTVAATEMTARTTDAIATRATAVLTDMVAAAVTIAMLVVAATETEALSALTAKPLDPASLPLRATLSRLLGPSAMPTEVLLRGCIQLGKPSAVAD